MRNMFLRRSSFWRRHGGREAQQGPAAPQVPSGLEAAERRRSRDDPHGSARQHDVVRLAGFGPDGVAQGTDVLRRARQSGCVARRKRRSVEHADHQL